MRVLISDTTLTGHPELVKQAFLEAYPTFDESEITISQNGYLNDLNIAQSGGAEIMIRSTTGASSYDSHAESYYNDGLGFLVCMPAGANSIGEVYKKLIPQDMCITGAGDEQNETADNVEYISNDPITPETIPDEQDLSSYSNGYIAGQLLKIKDSLGLDDWELVRKIARLTASNNNVWHETDGYGFINVESALEYQLIVGNLKVRNTDTNEFTFYLDAVEDADEYEIIVDDGSTITTSSTTYVHTASEVEKVKYRGKNGSLYSNWKTTYWKTDYIIIK